MFTENSIIISSFLCFCVLLSGRVTEGDDVTLNPETEIQRGDKIQWLFEDTLIAEIRGENREMKTHDGPDERFRDRLELNETGSLTIKNILTEHTGLYTLKITRGRKTLKNKFMVSVEEMKIAVMEGKSVTLKPAYEIKTDDRIYWLFGDKDQKTGIAEFNGKTGDIIPYDYVAGGIFRDRLELDEMTGSLTIKNTRTEHSGHYKLQIISSSGLSEQTFIVTVKVEEKFLEGEDSVTLKPDTEIQRDDQILWMFGDQDKLIAQIRGGTPEIYDDDVNERFRGRLKLDETGSLTITEIEAEHTGLYKLQISSSRGETLYKRFMVLIKLRYDTVTVGESVRLYTEHPKNQTFKEIQWLFGDEKSLIAEIKGGTVVTHDGPDERFRDRLELDVKTGNLTIKNSTYEHAGHYKLKISSSEGNTNRTYIVIVRARNVTVNLGESVHLNTGLNKIQRGGEIEWMFGDKDSLIAEIKGGTVVTHDGPDERFRDRLKLDVKTGDLIIKNSSDEHAGRYKLKISSSKGKINKTFIVIVRDALATNEAREKSSMKENTDSRGNRVNESATVEIPLLDGDYVNVVNEEGTSSL
ncbi:uncharacterized protein LOC132160261 [Carassius carassius]|uniref:uncharacterized protein LOC132160261 n=1 Tax=Carassius carassius TaxID=217509 RepID=UPI0028689128|nr:uncharacterized protein LOC132160261 [Carassius carassius]